jgi:hypothetical protein
MRKYIPRILHIIMSSLILGIVSCTPQSCFEDTTSFVNATFYKAGSNTATIADSITVFGIGKESYKLYNKALKVSVIQLPLDASSETCGFVMKINNLTDTLKLTYSSYPHLISKECGVAFFFTLESYSISGTAVDTILFRNKNITTFHEENIRIFY